MKTSLHARRDQLETAGRAGFTMIEMVIAVLVVAIITSVAVPRGIDSHRRHQLQAAAHHLALDLRYAASHAGAKSQPQTVTFTPASQQYEINGLADPNRPSLPFVVDLTRQYGVQFDSVLFNGATPEVISFDGYGRPTDTGLITLSRGAYQISILLDANGEIGVCPVMLAGEEVNTNLFASHGGGTGSASGGQMVQSGNQTSMMAGAGGSGSSGTSGGSGSSSQAKAPESSDETKDSGDSSKSSGSLLDGFFGLFK